MKKLMMTAAMGVALAACSPKTVTICEDVYFSGKLGEEVEQRCSTYLQTPIVQAPVSGDNGDTLPTPTDVGTTPPDGPEDEPETTSDDDTTNEDDDNGSDTGGTGGDDDSGGAGDDTTDDDPVKGNNGHGNGDQPAPGNSGDNNNAENSGNSGQGNSGRGRGGKEGTPNNN